MVYLAVGRLPCMLEYIRTANTAGDHQTIISDHVHIRFGHVPKDDTPGHVHDLRLIRCWPVDISSYTLTLVTGQLTASNVLLFYTVRVKCNYMVYSHKMLYPD